MSDNNMIIEMKTLFSGCDSKIDAMHMTEPLLLKYPDYKKIIISYRDSLIYPDNIDLMAKVASLESVYSASTRDDALNLKNSLSSRSNDPIYLRALERIVSRKRNKRNETNRTYIPRTIIGRECPHCGETMRMPVGTTYVICGYPDENRGYDWKGCCGDWCFACGKMLCKTWERDELNVESNRHHDDNCCRPHAKKNGHNYLNNYCHCIQNHNVTRKDYISDNFSDIGF
jgi:hypothetical protein